MNTTSVLILSMPFIGTTLGAAMVFFMANKLSEKIDKVLLGFASGVMIAASIWSLIMPAIEMSEKQNITPWIPAAIGFSTGILGLLIIDRTNTYFNLKLKNKKNCKLKNTSMLILAVTLHNIPEGMAVGVVLAGALNNISRNYYGSSFCLSVRNCNTKFTRRINYFYATKN